MENNNKASLDSVNDSASDLWWYIRLTKETDLGTINNHEIYEGYKIEGYINRMPIAGERFNVLRTQRNGIQRLGQMSTSAVQEVLTTGEETIVFSTMNSTYRLVILEKSVPSDKTTLDKTP